MEAVAEREAPRRLHGNVIVDHAYLGGKHAGKPGRGSRRGRMGDSASGRSCGGSILRITASMRSLEHLGAGLSSSPPVPVTVSAGGGAN